MANKSHASLTGASLHEPKGVASASASTVYVADGLGSGSWVDINTLLTSTNFTTGDGKLTLKTTADSAWVMANDGTIGDALSSATTRANADCEDLFTLLWTNMSNTDAAVSGGRGANAAADWAAHKTIALTKQLGRALVIAGAGSGLTTRTLGSVAGAETVALVEANLASHSHTGTTGSESVSHNHTITVAQPTHTHLSSSGTAFAGTGSTTGSLNAGATVFPTGATNLAGVLTTGAVTGDTATAGAASVTHTHDFTTASVGSGTAHANVQPSSFWNIMIKL